MFGSVTTAAQLMVKVGADTEAAQRKLNGMSKEFDSLKAAGTKMAMGVTVAVAAVGAATVAFANKAIQAGSDLEESQNKVNVVFGQSASSMERWAKTSNMAMGMTKQAALDNAGALGNLFSQLGAGQAKAAEMSRGLVSLSADLASFHNATGGATEVLDAISASFRGEYDAMQRYIPTLNAAAVEHQALAMTGKATADSLTAMDKALATQAIMLRDAGAALGDFSRTSGGWANLNRILQATLADLTTEIGTRLLPVITPFLQQLVDFVQNVGPSVVTTIGQIVTSFQSMVTAIGQVDFSAVTAQFEGLKQSIGVDFWAQVFGFIGQQIALTVTNFQELGFELSSIGEQFKAFGEFLKGDASWSEYRDRMKELQVEYDNVHAAFQTTYDEINGRDWGGAVAALNAVSEANAQATDWWQRHSDALRAVNDDTSTASDALVSLADVWTQAYQAIQDATVTGMDNSRLKVLQTFNGMAQDYANHATTIVDLENRKGQMVAYLESVYQQQAATLQAAGQTAQLADLTRAHQAKIKAVLASYNTQITLERSGQTALLSNAKSYYLTTLSMMAKALVAQVAVVKANMTALVRMIVSGYGSAAAAAYAFNKIKEGMADIGAINAAMAEVTSAFDAIEGAGIGAITEASQAFKDWQTDIGGVADGLGAVGDGLGDIGSGAQEKLIDPLEAAARVVEGIGQMIQRAIDAFNTLAKWGGPQAGWVDKFNLLAAALVTMVQKWAAAVQQIMPLLEEDKRNAIMQFSEMVRAVMSALQSAITVMGALEEYEGVFAVSAEAVTNILNFVKDMANRFAVIAKTFKEEVLVQVKSFTETAISVMKLISDAVTALLRLQDYDMAIGTLTGVIDQIVTMTKYLVAAFAVIADDFSDLVLNDLKKFADGAGAVLKLVGDAIGSLLKLKDFASTSRFYSLSNELIKQIHYLVVAFSDVAVLVEEDLREEAQKFATAAGPVLKLVGDAIGSLLKLKDFASTSRFYSLSNELIKQILYLVNSFGQVAALVDEELLEAAKLFAAAASPVVKLIGDAVGGLMAFKDYDKAMSVASAGAEKLVQQIAAFVRKLSRLGGQLGGPALEAAKDFAATAGPVVKLVGDAIENLMKFKDYDKSFSLANAGADQLVQQIAAFVRKLARLGGQLGGPALEAAKAFAATAGPVVNLIGDAIEGLMKFKDYDKTFNLHDAGAGKIVDQIAAFVRKFVRLGQAFGQPALLAAQQFAEAAADVVATLSDALDLLTKIKTYVGPSGNALLAFERDVEDMLLRFTRWVVFVIQPIAAGIDSDAMQAMQDMVNGLSAALELLTGLVDYVSPSAAALTAFMDGVQQLAEDFFQWAHNNGPQLFKEIPPEFLAAFRDVFEGLGAAVDVLTALVDFVAPSVMAVMAFEEGYQRLFMDWLTWAQNNFGQIKSELLIAIATVFQQVMEGLKVAVDVLTALVDFVPPSVMAVMSFEEGYQRLFRDWVTWATTTFTDLDTELVAAVASVFGDVFTGLGAAVDTLIAIKDYVSPGQTAISSFEADYQRLFNGFVTWAETTFDDIINTELIVAVAGAMNDLFTGLGAAVTVLQSITGYISPSEDAIAAFEADYQRIATDFATWAETAWTPEMAAATTAVGNAVNSLFTGLGVAVTVLGQIRNYTPPSQAVVDQFIADMTGVIGTMLTWVQTSFDPDAQLLMTNFGRTITTLFSGIGTALTVLQGIAEYTVPESQFILALQRFNANLLTAITSWVTWLSTTFTPETTAFLLQFHTIMSTIVTDMNAALQLLIDIEQAPLPTIEDLQHFLELVAELFDGVIYAMGDHAAGEFMVGLLRGMQNVRSQGAVIQVMRDFAETLEAELRAAWGIHSPSKVAERLGGFFVSGLARGLKDLDQIPTLIQNQLAMGGVSLGADVRFSPAPRHDRLTIEFQGAYQAGMSPAEEKRITQAMVGELRRQGVALQVARV